MRVDVAIVGAGGAGSSLLVHLARLLPEGAEPPSIAVIDPVHHAGRDRTWCFWDAGSSPVEPAVHRAWRDVLLVDAGGAEHRLDLSPLRYVMIRSQELYALADAAAERLGAVRVNAPAGAVSDGPDGAIMATGDGEVRARWVLDSRPAAPRLAAMTAFLQHFRGWTVRFGADVLDPTAPVFMDFSVPQPARGVAFGYVLPDDARTGLVEYTEFSRERLAGASYERHLRRYLRTRWGDAGADGAYEVKDVEDGAIPMTDAVHARRAGASVIRLGTAGGATRASTGYTFAAMQRQSAAVAAALLGLPGGVAGAPVPPAAYPARHRWMDSVLLRALDAGLVRGSELLPRLLLGNPPERVLRFLDGRSSLLDELAIMSSTPTVAMTRATASSTLARARRRLRAARS